MKKQVLYFDLDNVLFDLNTSIKHIDDTRQYEREPEDVPGMYNHMDSITEAINAYQKLSNVYDTYILSTASLESPSELVNQLNLVKDLLDKSTCERIIITHHVNLIKGDFFITNCLQNNIAKFDGKLIEVGTQDFPDYSSILKYLLPKQKQESYTHIEEILTLELPLRKDTFVHRITSREQLEEDEEVYGYYGNIIERKIVEIKSGKYGDLYNEEFFDSESGWYEDTQRFIFEIGDYFEVTVDVVDVSITPDYEFNEVKAYIECNVEGKNIPQFIKALELDTDCEFECLEETLDILFTEIGKCKERYLKENSK